MLATVGVVRDHHHRALGRLETLEDLEHVRGVRGVERARGFVGEDHERVGHDRARERDALLLAARHLHRAVIRARAETELLERGVRALVPFTRLGMSR